MKKLFYLCIAISVIFTFTNCSKDHKINTEPSSNYSDTFKEGIKFGLSVSFKSGHESGALCYVPYQGDIWDAVSMSYFHFPCIGRGDDCTWSIAIGRGALEGPSEEPVVATFKETIGLDTLHMPALSFLFTDSITATAIGVDENDVGTWINMPSQTWIKIDSINYLLPIV